MNQYFHILPILLLTACSTVNHPFGGVEKMSADTLCYRAAYAKPDPVINAEIKRRRLDCADYL